MYYVLEYSRTYMLLFIKKNMSDNYKSYIEFDIIYILIKYIRVNKNRKDILFLSLSILCDCESVNLHLF